MKNKSEELDIKYVNFDHTFLKNDSSFLMELAKFYCSIWMYDDNFGEYRICPTCEKYYNQNEVEVQGITTCNGDTKPHSKTDLVLAWDPNKVAQNELLGDSLKYGKDFLGVFAIDNKTNKIVGFTWGWLESIETIKERWGPNIANLLGNSNSTYYSDIADDKEYRGLGIGKKLCRRLTNQFSEHYPNSPSFLRTHKDSPAKTMFENVGYQYFANDPQHGDGRIMMMVKKAKDLNSK